MSAPTTRDELLGWFLEGHNVQHDRTQLERLVDSMLTQPPIPNAEESMSPSWAWNEILAHHLMYREAAQGWVTREGEFMGCAYAAHDRLVHRLGMEVTEVEQAGWARLYRGQYRCGFRLSSAQKKSLSEHGYAVDPSKELIKPRFSPNAMPDFRPTMG